MENSILWLSELFEPFKFKPTLKPIV
jgi:hypothetical protein